IKKEEKVLKHTLKKVDFSKIKKKIKKKLPTELDHNTLEKFIREKIDAGNTLQQAQMTDEALHTLRKYFKDINYNLKLYRDDITNYLPPKSKQNTRLYHNLPEELG